MRRLLGALVLLLSLPAFAETCTCDDTTGAANWTAICTGPTWEGCTCDLDDDFDIGSGCTLTIPNGSTVTQGTIAGADVQVLSGGSLTIAAGGELQMGATGIIVDSGGTFAMSGKILEFIDEDTDGTWEFNQDAPGDLTEVPIVGDIIHCPGDDDVGGAPVEDCGAAQTDPGTTAEIALCWPDATYNTVTNGHPGEQFYDQFVSTIAVGDVVWFWDPTGGANPPRDVNSPYEVVDVKHGSNANRCIYLNVHQGTNDPAPAGAYTLALREVERVTTSADYEQGERNITVSSGAVANDEEREARYLTCTINGQVSSGTASGIVRTTDGGAGADTLLLDPMGLPADLTSGTVCYIDHGWQRGDPIFVMRPARLSSSTTTDRDSVLSCTGDCTLTNGHIDSISHTIFYDGSTPGGANTWWEDSGRFSGSRYTISLAATPLSNITLTRWAITGSDTADDDIHCMEVEGDNFTLEDFNFRYCGDDGIYNGSGGGGGRSLNIYRYRCSYLSGSGLSSSCIENADAHDLVIADLLSEAWGIADYTDTSIMCTDSSGSCHGVNVVSFANRGKLFQMNPNVDHSWQNVYDIGANCCTTGGGEYWAASTDRFVIRDLVFSQLQDQLSNVNTDQVTRYGLIRDISGANRYVYNINANGGITEHVVFLNPSTTSVGNTDTVLNCTGTASATAVRNVSVVWSPGTDTSFDYAFQVGACTASEITLRGFLVSGMKDDADADVRAIGIQSSAANLTDMTWGAGPCFFDNTDDAPSGNLSSLPSTTVRDMPPGFYDLESGDVRLKEGTVRDEGCGAWYFGVRDMWPLRVRHIDPKAIGDEWLDRRAIVVTN